MRTISVTPIVKSANNITCKENSDIEIAFEALPEDIQPESQFEEPYLSKFLKMLDKDQDLQYCGVSHNWFCAKVTVKYKGFEGTDHLGGCSYKSYDQFCKLKNDYFGDMVSNCVHEINEEIRSHNADVRKCWEIRKNMIERGYYLEFLENRSTLKSY